MCRFNTGCPGWLSEDGGFMPCTEETGCAFFCNYTESLNDPREYALESNGRYDRYVTTDGESMWICGDCGEEVHDFDKHDEECCVEDATYTPPRRNS